MFQIRLKELREKAHLSQASLAKKIGVSQSTVGMWESGRNKPKNAQLVMLSTLFGVSADFLLGIEDKTATEHEKMITELTDDELELLTIYRNLNADAKNTLLRMARYAADSHLAQEGLIQNKRTS